MFDVACEMIVQLIGYIPIFLALWLIFDFLGAFFFGGK